MTRKENMSIETRVEKLEATLKKMVALSEKVVTICSYFELGSLWKTAVDSTVLSDFKKEIIKAKELLNSGNSKEQNHKGTQFPKESEGKDNRCLRV